VNLQEKGRSAPVFLCPVLSPSIGTSVAPPVICVVGDSHFSEIATWTNEETIAWLDLIEFPQLKVIPPLVMSLLIVFFSSLDFKRSPYPEEISLILMIENLEISD
jgi:hypothetical protein